MMIIFLLLFISCHQSYGIFGFGPWLYHCIFKIITKLNIMNFHWSIMNNNFFYYLSIVIKSYRIFGFGPSVTTAIFLDLVRGIHANNKKTLLRSRPHYYAHSISLYISLSLSLSFIFLLKLIVIHRYFILLFIFSLSSTFFFTVGGYWIKLKFLCSLGNPQSGYVGSPCDVTDV